MLKINKREAVVRHAVGTHKWVNIQCPKDSFQTKRLVCIETDGLKDLALSTQPAVLIKNIYTI